MTNPMELWMAWWRGWMAATNSLLQAQQGAMQRMVGGALRGRLPEATTDGTNRMRQAMRQAAADMLPAAGDKPGRRGRRGRPAKAAASGGRRRGRGRKSR